MTARALAEQRVFAAQLQATGKGRFEAAILGNTHIAGSNPDHTARLVIKQFGCGKARINLDTQRLCFAGEPFHHLTQRDDIVAVIIHQWRHHPVGKANRHRGAKKEKAVILHLRGDRGTLLLPVGDKLVDADRVNDGARQDMGAGLRALLDDDHRNFGTIIHRQLFETDGGGQTCRSGANNHHIVVHLVARWLIGQILAHSCHSPRVCLNPM